MSCHSTLHSIKTWGTSLITILVSVLLWTCREPGVRNMKDLNENMIDLKIYQENWGDHVESGRLEEGEWLLTGMDSLLKLLSVKFKEHRKLSEPFSYFYKKDLKPPILRMMKAVKNQDTASARKSYRILVKKCNDCHIDHDINKLVRY